MGPVQGQVQGQAEATEETEETTNICRAICRSVFLLLRCPTAFRPEKWSCKWDGGLGAWVYGLSCCNIFMAGMEYLNSYNFRISQRAAVQRGHRSLQPLRECGESRARCCCLFGFKIFSNFRDLIGSLQRALPLFALLVVRCCVLTLTVWKTSTPGWPVSPFWPLSPGLPAAPFSPLIPLSPFKNC